MQAIRKSFVDTFQRSNTSTDPGIATDGSRWNVLSGTFNIANNTLTTSTAASSYPMSVVDMGVQDVNIGISSPGQGAMAALWVTDSGNWWGVQTFSQNESCNCVTSSYACNGVDHFKTCNPVDHFYSCNPVDHYVSCNCGQYATGTYYCMITGSVQCNCSYAPPSYTPGYCAVQVGYYCASYVAGVYFAGAYTCSSCPVQYCSADYAYGCQSCYSYTSYSQCYDYTSYSTCYSTSCSTCYPQYVRVLNSVAGTVSALWSQVVAAVIASFRVKTKSNVITIQI
jgi:hypothetical protein